MKKAHTGLLHLSTDQIVMSDSIEKLVLPSWTVISTLDIFIFSKKQKTCIIIELTCLCEENIKVWHQKKIENYKPLINSIKPSRWSVHLFAMEVGARGYCSKTVN